MSDKRKSDWWIDEQKHDMLQSVFDRPVEGCVHVIEHSAYLALESEALKLEAALEKVADETWEGHTDNGELASFVDTELIDRAREALVQFKKWRGGE